MAKKVDHVKTFARTFHKDHPTVLLTFTMSEGDTFETDPELVSAARTDKLIPRADIKIVRGEEGEVPL